MTEREHKTMKIINCHEESPDSKTGDRSSRNTHAEAIRHEESPNPETSDPPTVILNGKDKK